MRRGRRRVFTLVVVVAVLTGLALLATAAAARSDRAGTAAGPATPTWFGDVAPILQSRCVDCHQPSGAAFSLRTYAQARTHRRAIAAAVSSRRMPPWGAARGHAAYRYDPSLTQSQIGAITRWVARRARKGLAQRKGRAVRRVAGSTVRPDVRLTTPSYTPPVSRRSPDAYRCFPLAWPQAALKYATGMRVVPDHPRLVRQVGVYLVAGDFGSLVDSWDAADAAPGYGCYDAPSPTGGPWVLPALLASWTQGAPAGQRFAEGTGLPIPPGTRLVVQVHYHLAAGVPAPESTAVQLQTADTVARTSFMISASDQRWFLEPGTFEIPPGARRSTKTGVIDTAGVFGIFEPGTVTLDLVVPYMHELGDRAVVRIDRGGTSKVVLAVPRWEPGWRRSYWLARPAEIRPGDALRMTCDFDNTTANQPVLDGRRGPPRYVGWGPGRTDENCLAHLLVSGRLRTTLPSALARIALPTGPSAFAPPWMTGP